MAPGGEATDGGTIPEPELFGTLVDVIEGGVVTLDHALAVRGWNRWMAMASGIDAPAALGRSVLDIFPELRGGPAEAAFRRALGGATVVWSQQFHGFLLPVPPPAGYEAFPRMQQSARIIPIGQGSEVDCVVVLVQDVTERVAREDDLRRALERAEVASQAKSEFLASMSHELRTPLAAIVGYMNLLEGEMVGPVEPLQKTYLGRVRTAARHLMSIIEEILTFSRVEAGKETTFLEAVDALELAREVEVLFEPQARDKALDLVLTLPAEALPMRTDGTKVRQILINLLGNALKFTDEGSVCLTVRRDGDQVVFTVSDTGPGIVAGDRERVFDAFTQLDQSLKRRKGGTGLGLPVSRKLALLLGGELTVDAAPDGGALFTLSLPLTSPSPAAYEPSGGTIERAKR